MTNSSTSTAVVAFDAAFADPKRLALAGFLTSYSGQTRDANALKALRARDDSSAWLAMATPSPPPK